MRPLAMFTSDRTGPPGTSTVPPTTARLVTASLTTRRRPGARTRGHTRAGRWPPLRRIDTWASLARLGTTMASAYPWLRRSTASPLTTHATPAARRRTTTGRLAGPHSAPAPPGTCCWRGRGRPPPVARRRAGRSRDHGRRGRTGCGACPTPTSASPGSTTTAPCARAWPRRSTGPARPPSSAPPSSPSCWPAGRRPVLLTRADDAPGRRRPGPQPRRAAHGTTSTVCWRTGRARGRAGRARHRRHRRPAGGRRVRRHARRPRARPDPAHRRRRGRRPPPAGLGRRAGRRRRRRRGGRHGGRAGQPGGRHHAGAGRGRAHQRRLRRQPRRRHGAAGHAGVVRGRASPSSASTTASAPPAPSCGC